MTTQTPNLQLNKPEKGNTDWADPVNANWDALDEAYGTLYPSAAHWRAIEGTLNGGDTWVNFNNDSCNGIYNSSPADGREITFPKRMIAAGTYTVCFHCTPFTNRGKWDVYAGATKLTANPVDMYGAGNGWAVLTTSVTIEESGEYVFMLKCNGKNASSTNYYIAFDEWWLK